MIFLCLIATFLSCGTERWAVKTLSDSVPIDTTVVRSTISYERSLPAPVRPTFRTTLERQEIQIQGTITAYKEEADGDYHLVFSDKGQTIIAEIPNPRCPEVSRMYANLFGECRAFVDSHGQATKQFRTCRIPVTITGVRFFDRLHGQRGVAPNGVEIHPVLRIQ